MSHQQIPVRKLANLVRFTIAGLLALGAVAGCAHRYAEERVARLPILPRVPLADTADSLF